MLRKIVLAGLMIASGIGLATAQSPSKLTVTVKIPADVPSFKGEQLELVLFEFDPKIADKKADKFDQVVIKDFSHEKGKETIKEVTLGEKANGGKTNPKLSYYLTVFVHRNSVRTHIGEKDGKSGGLCRVLNDGAPNMVNMVVRPVK